MPLPPLNTLLDELDRATHAQRCRRVVTLAVAHRDDSSLPELLDDLAETGEAFYALTLLAAGALGDDDRLREGLRHPSPRVREVAARRVDLAGDIERAVQTYLNSSLAVRATFRSRLRRERLTVVADALCRRDIARRELSSSNRGRVMPCPRSPSNR